MKFMYYLNDDFGWFKVWVEWGIIERLSWFFGEFEYDNGLRSRRYN